jgi:hypothetical protein
MMLLIYTPFSTSRIKYIFRLIFDNILKTEYQICNDVEEYKAHNGYKINYSKNDIEPNEIHIFPVNLLFETKIREQEIHVSDWNDTKIFFQTESANVSMPFDLFAGCFYLVTRYEEYLPHMRDKHNRFKPTESLAFQNNFLQKPLINDWLQIFNKIITDKFPDIKIKTRDYKYILTFDIDIAFAHKYKGFLRTFISYLKLIKNLQFKEIMIRTKTLLGLAKDPYDNYEYMTDIQQKYHLQAVYFILLGDFGKYDKNLSHLNYKFQSLIKHISDYSEVGIHSSYASNTNSELILKEIERLKSIINKEIKKNRQHFLMLYLPNTYRNLLEVEITDDYTMGYASEPGFRASICTPFLFYNLNMEYETNITVHPFAYMEGTFAEYKKMKPFEAQDIIFQLIDEVKKVNGDFISLWHNHSLCEEGEWKGWKKVFEETVNYGAQK